LSQEALLTSFPGVPTLNDPEIEKYRVFSEFFAISGCVRHIKSDFFAEITGDRPRQLAYEIKLMLSRVSRALAQIYRQN